MSTQTTDETVRQLVGKTRRRSHNQKRGNARRKMLCIAASEMLAYTPVEELTFRAVAKKAGVPEGSAYHFYANKYDLLSDVISDISEDFLAAHAAAIPDGTINAWRDLADLVIQRGADVYATSPAALRLCLGGHVPEEVKRRDRINNRRVSRTISDLFDRYFVMPPIHNRDNVFYYAIELGDLMFSLSVAEHGDISESMLAEAKRVVQAYLGAYLPEHLDKTE